MKYYKYYICRASASFVGTEEHWKLKAKSKIEAMELFADTAIQHIEGYEDPEEFEEETGTEFEYDYSVEEVSEKEYKENEAEELDY